MNIHDQKVLLNLLKAPNDFIQKSIELVGVHDFLYGFSQLWLLGPRNKKKFLVEYIEVTMKWKNIN